MLRPSIVSFSLEPCNSVVQRVNLGACTQAKTSLHLVTRARENPINLRTRSVSHRLRTISARFLGTSSPRSKRPSMLQCQSQAPHLKALHPLVAKRRSRAFRSPMDLCCCGAPSSKKSASMQRLVPLVGQASALSRDRTSQTTVDAPPPRTNERGKRRNHRSLAYTADIAGVAKWQTHKI